MLDTTTLDKRAAYDLVDGDRQSGGDRRDWKSVLHCLERRLVINRCDRWCRGRSTASVARGDVDVEALPLEASPILGRRGWDLQAPYRAFAASASGRLVVRSEEVNRVELRLGGDVGSDSSLGRTRYQGFLRAGTALAPLPIGAHLDGATGAFTWAPGLGFVGPYDLVFIRSVGARPVARQEVRIVLHAKGRGSVGPQVEIDAPKPDQRVSQPFLLSGWAADLNALFAPGVTTLHTWAYPVAGGPPLFLGATTFGGSRQDVAAVHGDQFRDSGFELRVLGWLRASTTSRSLRGAQRRQASWLRRASA